MIYAHLPSSSAASTQRPLESLPGLSVRERNPVRTRAGINSDRAVRFPVSNGGFGAHRAFSSARGCVKTPFHTEPRSKAAARCSAPERSVSFSGCRQYRRGDMGCSCSPGPRSSEIARRAGVQVPGTDLGKRPAAAMIVWPCVNGVHARHVERAYAWPQGLLFAQNAHALRR